jgi:N6-L-threonylcarbamoyladenine synthase
MNPARILAIESSCDETACAILENGRALLSSTVASQMELHARYGGVLPEVASTIVPPGRRRPSRSARRIGDKQYLR